MNLLSPPAYRKQYPQYKSAKSISDSQLFPFMTTYAFQYLN